MKTIVYVCMVLFVSIVLSIGCSKQTQEPKRSTTNSSEEDQQIISLIENFKALMNSQLKDGNDISIDSAIWYLEATLNETYARFDYEKAIHYTDTCEIRIPISRDALISTNDLVTAYDQLVDSLSEFYQSVSGDKGVIMDDIAFVSSSGTEVILQARQVIGITTSLYSYSFGETDYWWWAWELGICGGELQGQGVGEDATTQLSLHANWELGPTNNDSFFINITSDFVTAFDVPLPQNEHNPFGFDDYYLFVVGSTTEPEEDQCLNPTEMNYYLDNLPTIAEIYRQAGTETIHYSLNADVVLNPNGWTHLHDVTISFGVPISTLTPPGQL